MRRSHLLPCCIPPAHSRESSPPRKPRYDISEHLISEFSTAIFVTLQTHLPAQRQKSVTAAKMIPSDDKISMGLDNDHQDPPTNKNAELHVLPKWAKSGWNMRFLRTLYCAINASE